MFDSAASAQRLACFSNRPPALREIKTGSQAAAIGGRMPFTPSELKLKLNKYVAKINRMLIPNPQPQPFFAPGLAPRLLPISAKIMHDMGNVNFS